MASVGLNILIGAPDDNAGAGAAFLYAPPALAGGAANFLTTFVQPDGGGGSFGTSVAGTQNTALIGAPGANLATSDAGAAYLFDANPASPTFGRAIGAAQEPIPTSGDAFGTAVGFDTGALIVGAAGAIGSSITGAEAVDIYQQNAAISLSSATTYATPAPGDSVILSGTYLDANGSAPLTATINWGDGSAPTVVNLPPASYAFSAPHDYTTDPALGAYTIGVTLSDIFGETTFTQTTVAISNPAPGFAAPGLILSSTSIAEGGAVTVSGKILSPGGIGANTVSLNWGDASPPTTIILPAGQDDFSAQHGYPSNPTGIDSASYTIVGSVTNLNGQSGYASATVSVNKVAPQFTSSDLSLSETNANEGDTVTLSGQFTDPDSLSSYSVTIDWGDGSTPITLNEIDGQVFASTTTPGLYTYSTTHPYFYNIADATPGSNSDTYNIQVSVTDGVNTASAATPVVVAEVPPAIQIESDVADDKGQSSTIYLTAVTTDADPLATDQVAWSVHDLLGNLIASGTGTSITLPDDGSGVAGIVTATVTSSDGASDTDIAQVAVIDQSGAVVAIDPLTVTISGGSSPGTISLSPDADRLIAVVYGAGDFVDARQETVPVELDGFGAAGLIVTPGVLGLGQSVSTDGQITPVGAGDTLVGGPGNDLLVAGAGADSLVGGTGDDTLVSTGGDDTLVGGSGPAVFQINPGPNLLVIGSPSGNNTLDFSSATQAITINLAQESGQSQTVDAAGGNLVLEGQFNTYVASSHGDSVVANDDNDLVYALAGNASITSGSGHDSIVGGSGNDIIYALSGNATITGGSGNESIVGGSGNDIIYTLSGNTTITGGSGNESIVGGSGNDIIYTLSGQYDDHGWLGQRFHRRRFGQRHHLYVKRQHVDHGWLGQRVDRGGFG